MQKEKIGFIGQGWIGKNYADDFEQRGFEVVRYSLEDEYKNNKDQIKDCDIVFICVPTPTTPKGFDDTIIRRVIKLVGKNKIAVIKSTILPGTTKSIQNENLDVFVFHSPEFLTEKTAMQDVKNPPLNLIGTPIENEEYDRKAETILYILNPAKTTEILRAEEAEFYKYIRNCFFYTKILFMNLCFDLATANNCRWENIKAVMAHDLWIGDQHIEPMHKGGRGAGGNCLIKDFAAFSQMYSKFLNDDLGKKILDSLQNKNIELLLRSGKDLDILEAVYQQEIKSRSLGRNEKSKK